MRCIDPKTSVAFNQIFGSEENHGILISSLNGILYEGELVITDLDILDPWHLPEIQWVKNSYLSVKVTLVNGETVLIKMQFLNIEGLEKRILYHAVKAYSVQLKMSQDNLSLSPVIVLTISHVDIFPDTEAVISRFLLKENNYLMQSPVHTLELAFVELPKFQKLLENLESLTDKWIYFLKYVCNLSTVPFEMSDVPEIRQAFEKANEGHLTLQDLDDIHHQLFFIQDQRGAITKAIQQSREARREENFQKGQEEGRQETQLKIAQRLLSIMEEGEIARITGLSLAEIQALRPG